MCVCVCVCVLFVDLFQDDLRCLFSPHQVNHGGVQKPPAQVSLYKSHTTEEPLRRHRSDRYCQVLSSHSFVLHYINKVLSGVLSLRLLDSSNGLSLLRITPDFPPVEFSLTHFPPTDLDFSLTDFPPASSEVVLTFLSLPPSPVFVFPARLPITRAVPSLLGLKKKFKKNKKESNLHSVTHRDRGGIGTHIIRESGLSLCV